jgi:hypothetical protein
MSARLRAPNGSEKLAALARAAFILGGGVR